MDSAMDSATDIVKMRKYLQDFSLDNCERGNQGYRRVLIQLCGLSGHGKSSFINSCKYVMDNAPFRVYATVAPSQGIPETMIRNSYQLTETITLVDNRGCIKLNKDETGEIYVQLGNFLPLDTKVEWHTGYTETITKILESERDNRYADFIVPVFIYNSEHRMHPGFFSELKEVLLKAKNITGIFPTVVLTHETSELLPENQENFRRMGANNIFSVENYTEENAVKVRKKHETLLKCLCEIIKDVEFRMEEKRDPLEESIARKKILHTFLLEREIERAKEEEALKRAKEEEPVKTGSYFGKIGWLFSRK
ncbi:uncharacterized protein ACMZJ9_010464 [Mantella aurantiaca]